MLVFQGAIFAAIFSVIVLSTLPGTLANAHENSIPVTSAAQLSPGAEEKVFGTVSLNQSTVILVFDYTDSSGRTVVGRHVENFWFNDSSGRILILMGSNSSSTPSIARGGQPYPSTTNPTGFEYNSGDPISILGNVGRQGNLTVLTALAVGSAPGSLVHVDLPIAEVFLAVGVGLPGVALVTGVLWTRSRLALHLKNLRSWTARRPKALLNAPPADEIHWFENGYLGNLRRQAWAFNAASVVLVTAFVVVVFSPIPFSQPVFLAVAAGVPVSLIFTGVFGVAQLRASRGGIRRLGVSSTGLYFDWGKPPKNARPFLAWSDVRELEAPVAADRRTIKLDTPLGHEYVSYLDPGLINRLRVEFEAARVPYRELSAPLRPSVESLLGTGPPTAVADVSWFLNPLRTRWALYGVIGLVAEIPLAPLLFLRFPELLASQGAAVFFLPGIFGAQFLYLGYRSIRAVGISTTGIHLRERSGERTILWSEIEELTPGARGFRYKTHTGFAEGIPMLDVVNVGRVVDGLNQNRGLDPRAGATPPPADASWLTNSIRAKARVLFVAMFVAPIAVSLIGIGLMILTPFNPNLILLAALPWTVTVFSLYPAVWWKSSPSRIAFTTDAVFVDSGESRDPGRLRVLRYTSITSLKGEEPAGGSSVVPGMKSYALTVRTSSGIMLNTGFVSPDLARAFAARLRGDQLKEWKIRSGPPVGG